MFQGIHNYNEADLEAAVTFISGPGGSRYPWANLVSPPFFLTDHAAAIIIALSYQYVRVAIQP